MGMLTPGATYIYERVDNIVYARESGSEPNTRKIIGYSLEKNQNDSYGKNIADRYFLEVQWAEILKAAEHSSALREAIERVKILYQLSKQENE